MLNYQKFDGTIFEAEFKQHAGGVARNITEAMSKLGCPPTFISVVGNDSYGHNLCSILPPMCSKNIYKLPDHGTAQCHVIFDQNGDCKLLIGDMDIFHQITVDMINKHEQDIKRSPLLILDGNLSLDAMEAALKIAYEHNVPVFFEPTDVPVSIKPFQTTYWKAIKYISPNLLELRSISNALNIPLEEFNNTVDEVVHIGKLLVQYIPTIIVTLGNEGLIIIRRSSASDALFLRSQMINEEIQIRHYPADRVTDLINVSGAGDCLASGIIVSMLNGLSEEVGVNIALTAARNALFSDSAVPKALLEKSHQCWNTPAKYYDLY